MYRSYFGGFRVKDWPTKVTLSTIRFHDFFFRFPDLTTLSTSSSIKGFTCSVERERVSERESH